ncbi:MAG: alpha/beta hydrolase [Candidatus Binataceae bacterium]
MTTTKSIASINGISIAYRDRGSGAAVVFVHGHPFDQSMWDPQLAALSWKYRTITLDLRGYGKSEVPNVNATTVETMAADIKSLLDHLGIQKTVVVGLSMGGQVAMAFADLFPERLAGLVLAGTFAEADTAETAAARRAMADRFVNEGSVLPGGEMLPSCWQPLR